MNSLPKDWFELSGAQQRKVLVQRQSEQFEAGNPNAWYNLLGYAIDADPDIPDSTKAKLHARLINAMNGQGSIDPISPERRKDEFDDMQVYAAMMQIGGSITFATKTIAKQHGVSVSTIRRAYERHLEREPNCPRLDGRKRQKKRQANIVRSY